jgi:hypothetical protein
VAPGNDLEQYIYRGIVHVQVVRWAYAAFTDMQSNLLEPASPDPGTPAANDVNDSPAAKPKARTARVNKSQCKLTGGKMR